MGDHPLPLADKMLQGRGSSNVLHNLTSALDGDYLGKVWGGHALRRGRWRRRMAMDVLYVAAAQAGVWKSGWLKAAWLLVRSLCRMRRTL